MTKKEEQRKVVFAYSILDKFTEIYPKQGKEQRMPDNEKLTVYFKGTSEEGFLFNVSTNDLGLEALIAFKWIRQRDFNYLEKNSKSL